MNSRRTSIVATVVAVLALVILAGTGLSRIIAPPQDPAFKMPQRSNIQGPRVYTPGTQRGIEIDLLSAIDQKLAQQNQELARIYAALRDLAED